MVSDQKVSVMIAGMFVITELAAGGLAGGLFNQAFGCVAVGIGEDRNKEKVQEKCYMVFLVFHTSAHSHKLCTRITFIINSMVLIPQSQEKYQ